MKTIFPKKEYHIPKWFVIDANGKTLGRLSTEVSKLLRGKENTFFTPGVDQGNYVVILNADKIEVSGKKTRSRSSWLINEKMLINNYGFITKVSNKEKFLSYYFFFFDKVTTVYFSSVTYREYFKIYKNLGHASIWSAIKYSKNVSKFLYLGDENSSSSLTNKEKNFQQKIN
jgi:hypothetical protein